MKTVRDKRTLTFSFLPVDKYGNSPVVMDNSDYCDGVDEMDPISAATYAMDLANTIACTTVKFQNVCKYLKVSKEQQNEIMKNIFKDLKQVSGTDYEQ